MDIQNLHYSSRRWNGVASRITALIILQIIGTQAIAQSTFAQDTFPRLGGYQIGGWGYAYNQARLDKVAKLDVAIIQLFVDHNIDGYSIADITSYLKSRNPNLKLLQYVIVNEVSQNAVMFQPIRDKVAGEKGPGGKGDWYARDAAGQHVWSWPGTYMLNLTDYVSQDATGNRVSEWLADWFSDQYFEVGGQWDGFYIDVMRVEPQTDPDWDMDGDNDSRTDPIVVDKYTAGQMRFHNRFMQRYPNFIGSGNITNWQVSKNSPPNRYENGISGGLIEGIAGFSWSQETWGGFNGMMATYRDGLDSTKDFILFHVLGDKTDYRFMRYTLAACLMDNGYYTHSTTDSYQEQAWFDEFDIDLGMAVDPPQTSPWSNGVYRRVFEHGVVLVNPEANGSRTVNVGPGLKRFTGTQDPIQNSGSSVTSLTLAAGDGIILVGENAPERVRTPLPPTLN